MLEEIFKGEIISIVQYMGKNKDEWIIKILDRILISGVKRIWTNMVRILMSILAIVLVKLATIRRADMTVCQIVAAVQ